MAAGSGHIIDPAGQARQALLAAVAEYGPQVLSNPAQLDGICRDRLTSLPGEYILIGSAARSDVPARLRERAASGSIDDAIRSVAAIVAAAHGLDTGACVWVVSEFAWALDYPLPGGTRPAAETVPSGFTAQGDPLPPGPTPASSATAGSPEPTGKRGPNRSILGLITAAALVLIYLGVAAGAHLAPFAGTQASLNSGSSPIFPGGPSGSPDPAADVSPDPAADPSPDVAPDPAPDPDPDAVPLNATLQSLIPSDVQSGNTCSDYGTPDGSVAAIVCSGVQGLAAGTFYYYLFANTSALNDGYNTFLQNASFPNSCGASDGKLEAFITSCQSTYTDVSPDISGTISEYLNSDSNPVIASTDDQQLVMCVMVGSDGGGLLDYWNSLQWIVTSG